MFESLSDRLTQTFRTLTGRGQLTEENIQSGLREVRLALLEADVNLAVVKSFIQNVREKCVGKNITKGVNAAQQVIKIVHDELVAILGGTTSTLELKGAQPASIMLVGLQGSGKTTSAGKLANFLRKQKMRPFLVPLDVYRPAAIDQLVTLAKQLNIPFYPSTTAMTPMEIAKNALIQAKEEQASVLLLDTAGRLHVDEPLMEELAELKAFFHPQEILFVADAMTGQEAVNVATSFHEKITLTGCVLTKMDGDARGGAALSIQSVLGISVKFVGVGEKLSEIEVFHPDRIASRILGMGDVLTLVEKAESMVNEEELKILAKKMKKAEFNFEDFLQQIHRLKKMGSMESLLKLLPGFGEMRKQIKAFSEQMPDQEMAKAEAMINSMTIEERQNPSILNQSRRARIARGAGVTVEKVHMLIKQFEQTRKMMKGLMSGKMPSMRKLPPQMQGFDFKNFSGMAQGFPELPGVEDLSPFGQEQSAPSTQAVDMRKKKKKERKKHGKK